jgi:hypothetical protein
MLAKFTAEGRCIGLIVLCVCLSGCGGSTGSAPRTTPPTGRMVYVDTATMQPLVHDVATSFPAVHPQTGKPTLRPALYCPKCQQWYAAPSVDQVNRVPGAGQCPKDRTALTAEGPWPDGSTTKSDVK